MERRGLSLAEIQEVPRESLILLVGPPGAGKSTFCHQVVLNGIAAERPVIFVTTEQSPAAVTELMRERGLEEAVALNFVDAFTETVGLTCTQSPETICANCADLNSMSVAIDKLRQRVGQSHVLLAFDSLTSPYLLNKEEIFRFIRLCLIKIAAEGNSVVALMDEGCGKEEDLGAIMSTADGILKMEIKEKSRIINVIKHPRLEPATTEIPTSKASASKIFDTALWDPKIMNQFSEALRSGFGGELERRFAVNLFWPNFMRWSGMLWDPKRFPMMTYEIWKQWGALSGVMIPLFPWYVRLFYKLYVPENFSKVKDMKKLWQLFGRMWDLRHDGFIKYMDSISKTDEHYIRAHEYYECCGFDNIGTTTASMLSAVAAGMCQGFEKERRDWNAVETKCVGLGDPYCEFKLVPGEVGELKASLEKDSSVVENIHERLMNQLVEFLINGKPLVERPTLGSDFMMSGNIMIIAAGERYRMAMRMGGAKSGKEVGERLMNWGLNEDDTIKRVIDFMNYCKVGKVTMDETIRITENRESVFTKYYMTKWEEPSCLFTTGFFNGLFSAVKNKHVREIKCIAIGDPYCEWEII